MSERETDKLGGLKCTVCLRHRHTLRPRQSKLNPTSKLFLCNECFEGKYEPRFLIVLIARSQGIKSVQDYIRNHKYHGPKIMAEEVIPKN